MKTRLRTGMAGIAALALLVGLVGPASAAILSATPSTISGATLDITLATPASPLGVSPEVYYDDASGTYYLYPTSLQPSAYTSTDGVSWTKATDVALPPGFDYSIVRMGPGSYRMYYSGVSFSAPPTVQCSKQKKQLYYATSSDLLHWTQQPGPIFDDVGCGVPVVITKPDGSYLLFYNTITSQHGIHMATSPDGLTWTKRDGLVADTPDLVDPAPLAMPDGTYLMVTSNRGSGGSLQQLEILSSPDGLTWTKRAAPLYAPKGARALDPVLKLVNGQLRVWFSYVVGSDDQQARISSAVLTLGKATTVAKPGAPCTKAGAKATYKGKKLVCTKVKGSLVWVVRR
ncbi:MAG: hypothetical protein Q8M17_05465 [Actinomycetota bacterium]|nr:hypothetical protein [Actinomycetota bacterium]